MKKIVISYYVHGTSVDNESDHASGWQDCELSELGIQQANELHEIVSTKKFDAVFSSDLKRAIDSAKFAFKNQNIIYDNRLRECNYGDLNGAESKIVEDQMYWAVLNNFPKGESYLDVEKRISSFISFLKTNYEESHIAIMAHRAPQLAFEVLLNSKTWEQAIKEDWRHTKSWQHGWTYEIKLY